jgi:hypothetical protein
MATLKLPENFDPYAIFKTMSNCDISREEEVASNEAIKYSDAMKIMEKLGSPVLSRNSIDFANGVWDILTPYLIRSIWEFIDAIELRVDKMLINYFIECIANGQTGLEEAASALMVLSFAHPCTTAINDNDKLRSSWDGPMMLMTAGWKKLTENKPFVDTMQAQLLLKREKIFARVPKWIDLNIFALLINTAMLTTILDKDDLNSYLSEFHLQTGEPLRRFCHLLDDFSFNPKIPFWGGKKFREFYISSDDTGKYLRQRHESFEMIGFYANSINVCSEKLKSEWNGSLLNGKAWPMMVAP